MGSAETLVGRQPIFDRDLAVSGYELLFRDVDASSVARDGRAGGSLTPEGLLGPAADGLGALVGSKTAFCNAVPCIISGETAIMAPPNRVVVEVDVPLSRDDTDLAGCRRLVDSGYTLAIDDLQSVDGVGDLLGLASIVKIDTEAVDRDQLSDLVNECRRFDVEVIAQNVDTPAMLGRCESLGFDRFQGFLLARPHAAPGGPLAPGRLAGLRVSARLLDAECPITVIEDIIRGDPAMSHQLLNWPGPERRAG